MTWLDLRLPPGTSLPTRAVRVVRGHVRIRFALFLLAWALVTLRWVSLAALPFEAAIAAVVLWHGLRRERLLATIDAKRVQLELVTAVAEATDEASDLVDLLGRAGAEIRRQTSWEAGRVLLPDGGTWDAAPGDRLRAEILATHAAAQQRRAHGVAIGFPVVVDGEVAAILEFLSHRPEEQDHALVGALAHVGGQLGQVVKRARAEAQVRAAEERYRALVETLPLATYVDRPGRVTGAAWVSPQIAAITSYGTEEWVADPELLERVLHPEDRDRVLAEMARVKGTGEALDHEYRIVRRDGSIVWVHDSAVTAVIDGESCARGYVVDVTPRREAEIARDEMLQQVREQNEQLVQLDRLKDEFVALVSHELRTPLTSIRGYLELMWEDGNLTPEQTRFLETIDRNAGRLQRVVGDLLFCAQVEAGKVTLEQGVVDPNALVRDAVDAATPAADAKSIRLVTRLEELPEISGDRARLAQVLDNLVSNAIKFTPSGGTVTLATRLLEGSVEVVVADTGMGIPADELPRLFERFFRTEQATATAIPGTGLGLAIARAIAEGHGGQIAVDSTEGAGTTFALRLPAAA